MHMTSANEGISDTINEHSIESVRVQKHLGIMIDKNLTWDQQIDYEVTIKIRQPKFFKAIL